jgi:hypothetical protein
MLIKLGKTPKTPHAQGIHWHIGTEVNYIHLDRERQDIPYIAVKGKDGRVTEYFDEKKPLPKNEIAKKGSRRMDCIDCHNRPSHIFHSPSQEMDESFVSGRIDQSLPFIKKTAIELITKNYASADEAKKAIAAGIRKFYAERYPDVTKRKGAEIDKAVMEVQGIYAQNFFPKMKVTWNTHTDNIGHFYYPGCFRCHDGNHKSKDGRTISKDCNLCHQLLGQKQENIPAGTAVTRFIHPVDIGDAVQTTGCYECHRAGSM